ncbi:hypothetical protein [Mycobacterium phage Weirdo19]|uniref:Uncharacterized protein n=1 Tax=Mycobacterium phage Weirdo19 TaxID=2601610 RepID=A0A6M2YSW7_9CAUD|nr:hypothetical protein KDJ11_gp59 [Mycobacterium phage Weirdo19]QEA10827.1 hypothetical protein [Mycobacterium phage Weirdo19]
MRFKGDRVDGFTVGETIGPGNDGFYRQITDVWFDETDGHTYVEAEVIEAAEPGRNIRYYGSADPDEGPPQTRERLPDRITPR